MYSELRKKNRLAIVGHRIFLTVQPSVLQRGNIDQQNSIGTTSAPSALKVIR